MTIKQVCKSRQLRQIFGFTISLNKKSLTSKELFRVSTHVREQKKSFDEKAEKKKNHRVHWNYREQRESRERAPPRARWRQWASGGIRRLEYSRGVRSRAGTHPPKSTVTRACNDWSSAKESLSRWRCSWIWKNSTGDFCFFSHCFFTVMPFFVAVSTAFQSLAANACAPSGRWLQY